MNLGRLLRNFKGVTVLVYALGLVGCSVSNDTPANTTQGPLTCTGASCGSGACSVGGSQYLNGSTNIPAGCNTCSCSNGVAACTLIACGTDGGTGGSASGTGGGTCDVSGTRYPNGASNIPSSDGCNTCSCSQGSLLCTLRACGGSMSCTYDGTVHQNGDNFPATDGCNSCSCVDGAVACTEIGCNPQPGDCTSHADCNVGEVCNKPVGVCDETATGSCQPDTQICTSDYTPVCGCDGQTYGNECSARAFGVGISAAGECGVVPAMCGGMECGTDQFCKMPQGTCASVTPAFRVASGVCTDLPTTCTTDDIPVCGCDGVTYSNACLADVAGVNVAQAGACPVVISCFADAGCAADEYCMFPVGVCGAGTGPVAASAGAAAPAPNIAIIALPSGTCTQVSAICTDIYAPVCGCDGVTYASACTAGAAKVSVSYDGECAVAAQ